MIRCCHCRSIPGHAHKEAVEILLTIAVDGEHKKVVSTKQEERREGTQEEGEGDKRKQKVVR